MTLGHPMTSLKDVPFDKREKKGKKSQLMFLSELGLGLETIAVS